MKFQTIFPAVLLVLGLSSPNFGQNVTGNLAPLPSIDGATQLFVKSLDIRDEEGWAVGYYRVPSNMFNSDTRSLAYRYEEGRWSIFPTPNPESNTGVVLVQSESVAISPTNNSAVIAGLYIANGSQSPDTLMFDYESTSWDHVITPGQSMFGAQGFLFEVVHVGHQGNVYMAGQFANPVAGRPTATLVVREDSTNDFDRHDGELISNSSHRFRAIDSTSDSDIWLAGAAGGGGVAIGRSYVSRFDGSSLNENSPPNISFGENLLAVSVMNNDDVWVSGVYQDVVDSQVQTFPLFWHWDGSSWTMFDSPAFAVDLIAFSSNEIYGVGNDTLVRWDGNSWTVAHQFNEPLMALRSIAMKSPNELMAVGENPFGDDPFVATYTIGNPLGDINQDGAIDLLDVQPLVELLANGQFQTEADINGDGSVDLLDVAGFVAILTP